MEDVSSKQAAETTRGVVGTIVIVPRASAPRDAERVPPIVRVVCDGLAVGLAVVEALIDATSDESDLEVVIEDERDKFVSVDDLVFV